MFWQMTLSADSVLPVEPLEERHPLGKTGLSPGAVSYTHLTLPSKLEV